MKLLNEAKHGPCELCGKHALLDKGNGPKWVCEDCYYQHGYQLPKEAALEQKVDEQEFHELLQHYTESSQGITVSDSALALAEILIMKYGDGCYKMCRTDNKEVTR